jgi:hypothetical protein
MNRVTLFLVTLLTLSGVLVLGCSSNEPDFPAAQAVDAEITAEIEAEEAASVVMVCGSCGHVKGDEGCCADMVTVCKHCDLAKGSPGCCEITKGEDVAFCSGCGQVKGSEACCSPTAETCLKCGRAKGAPLCCI